MQQISQRKIVLAHDYLTQCGGAERVTLELAKTFNPEYIVTSFYSPNDTFPEFRRFDIRVGPLNKFRIFRSDPRFALPLLAFEWSMRRPIDADVLICSSSGWAHALNVTPSTCKIVYCHNPARWLHQPNDYLMGKSKLIRLIANKFRPFLLNWDKQAAASANIYIANSTCVAERIQRAYGRKSIVVFPPIGLDAQGPCVPLPGIDPPFFVTVARSRAYKGTQTLIEAFHRLPHHRLIVIGASKNQESLPPNVHVIGFVPDDKLRWLYKNARALISVSREDFGLTPIEANLFGTPALVLRAGGFLDSTKEGVSGLFIDRSDIESIVGAVSEFPEIWDKNLIRNHASSFSSENFSKKIEGIILGALTKKVEVTAPLDANVLVR